MSDYLPIAILDKIMKLMQLRSVSKTWKSWIDSSEFVHTYTRQQHHLLVKYYDADEIPRFISIADDDTFPFNTISLNPPTRFSAMDQEHFLVIGCSHGLLCYFYSTEVGDTAVIWNPCIRRAFRTYVPNLAILNTIICSTVLGFGVCPVTNDPKIVNITSIPFQAELFTLSSGAWRSISGNLPRISVRFESPSCTNCSETANGFVYWLATDMIQVDGVSHHLIVSFDLTREEFVEVHLPNRLARSVTLTMSKVRESLVILQNDWEPSKKAVGLWMMEDGLFTQRYTFNFNGPELFYVSGLYGDREDAAVIDIPGYTFEFKARIASIIGFRQTGDAIIELDHELVICRLISNELNNLRLDGIGYSLIVYPYMETLFLHDRQDLTEVVQDYLV